MQERWQVLVIEDDKDTREMIQLVLHQNNFDVLSALDGAAGIRTAYEKHPDAIILDVMMPNMDGFETCRRLREMTDIPILFLTGEATETEDIVQGLDLGADEYMMKPFKIIELISRLKANLRRAHGRAEIDPEYLYPAPSIVLNCERHELTINDQTVYLSPNEFEVLRYLARYPGRVLSHNAILTHVWGPDRIGETNLLKQYIYQLRQKIEPNPHTPTYIHTVRDGGYYFTANGG